MLESELDSGAWNRLSELLELSCTQVDWILISFVEGAVAEALALVTHSEFGLPLELLRFRVDSDERIARLQPFQLAIEKATNLGSRELFYTLPEGSSETELIASAGFRRWRDVIRFESADPIAPGLQGYRSAEVDQFDRAQAITLIEQTSDSSSDSQLEFYRGRFGSWADAEMTLRMLEFTEYDPHWWKVALASGGIPVGIILPVLVFGEPTIGFIAVRPEWRGRRIASFLLADAWSSMKYARYPAIYAEADQRNVSMYRALTKSGFKPQCRKQEWRLELVSTRRRVPASPFP